MDRAYEKIERALAYLGQNYLDQPDLALMAKAAGMSPFHFQRLFQRWAGVTPKKFCQYLTLAQAKASLERSKSVLDATYDSGLSSPGRLHDLFLTWEAMTPGEYKRLGKGLAIEYGFHATPFGEALFAQTSRGLCGLFFSGKGGRAQCLKELKAHWPGARFAERPRATEKTAKLVFGKSKGKKNLRLLLKGTAFQIKVWEAVLRVPPGGLISYGDLAKRVGSPGASRAVGSALGRNEISYLIPCHRVIREMGVIGPYRWKSERKKAMIGWEAAGN